MTLELSPPATATHPTGPRASPPRVCVAAKHPTPCHPAPPATRLKPTVPLHGSAFSTVVGIGVVIEPITHSPTPAGRIRYPPPQAGHLCAGDYSAGPFAAEGGFKQPVTSYWTKVGRGTRNHFQAKLSSLLFPRIRDAQGHEDLATAMSYLGRRMVSEMSCSI